MSKASGPRVVELFAGVGGFRIGLERSGWRTVWANQWEPSTKTQHAYDCYVQRFGPDGAVCEDIHEVMNEAEAGHRLIPDHELLVGGFPCQDYSVAKTLNQATGIVGKKGVLWWEIYRLLMMKRPPYLFLENVDRLLKSPTAQRGRDFGVMLAALANLGYEVEWRVVNAADYGFPQKRRRVLLLGRHVGAVERDPNDVVYGGTLARALPVAEGPVLSSSPTFVIDGTPADVSEAFGATKGVSPFRNAGYMSQRRVWTLDLERAWDGESLTLGDILEPADEVPEQYFIPADELGRWVVPERRQARAALPQGLGHAVLLCRRPHPLPRPDRLAGQDHPDGRRRTHAIALQAPYPGRRWALSPSHSSRAGAPERVPRRLDRHRHARGSARIHDGQRPRGRAHRARRIRTDGGAEGVAEQQPRQQLANISRLVALLASSDDAGWQRRRLG